MAGSTVPELLVFVFRQRNVRARKRMKGGRGESRRGGTGETTVLHRNECENEELNERVGMMMMMMMAMEEEEEEGVEKEGRDKSDRSTLGAVRCGRKGGRCRPALH